MVTSSTKSVAHLRHQLLADFRHQLRVFLQFSENAAASFHLHPQQHQLMLQIAGAPDDVQPTVSYVTDRLGLRHNTTVELSKRCEEAGLVIRQQDVEDKRRVILALTPKGQEILEALSSDHARELNELAPKLIKALSALSLSAEKVEKNSSRSKV